MNANTESGRKHEFCSETLHDTVWRKPKLGFCFFCFFFCSRAIQLKVLAEQKVTNQVVITLINNGWMIWAEFNFQCVFRCILAPFCSFRSIGRLILFGLMCLSPFLWYCTGQDSLGITLIRSLLILLPPGQYSFCRQTTGAVVKPRETKVDRFIAAFLVLIKMSGDAEPGKAKAAGIVSIVIAILALGNIICGFINVALGAPDGSGLWSGFGVSYQHFLLHEAMILRSRFFHRCITWKKNGS